MATDQIESDPASDSGLRKPDYDRAVAQHTPQAEAAIQERLRQEALAERDRHVATLKRQAGSRLSECRFSTFSVSVPYQRTVLATLREWVETIQERIHNGEGLVLYGPVGTGKDHLAFSAVGEAVFRTGASIRWCNGRELAGTARDRIATDASEREFVSGLTSPLILVISDPLPPVGELSPYQADMMYRICESRYASKRITITTLNVADDDEADRRLGAATWDRLCHGAWKIACKWPSYRKPAKDIKP